MTNHDTLPPPETGPLALRRRNRADLAAMFPEQAPDGLEYVPVSGPADVLVIRWREYLHVKLPIRADRGWEARVTIPMNDYEQAFHHLDDRVSGDGVPVGLYLTDPQESELIDRLASMFDKSRLP